MRNTIAMDASYRVDKQEYAPSISHAPLALKCHFTTRWPQAYTVCIENVRFAVVR